ncbi:MAG: ATP synthase F0 subunit B [Myxococcota bacterium]|nr:ATP synthase F0 subunit B [Myxococcota bacterium]
MTREARTRRLRQLAFATMVLVTLWSVWAWAGRAPNAADGLPESTPSEGSALRGADHEERPPPVNWVEFGKETPPYIAMVINFGILLAGYYLLGRKPIGEALQRRRESIAKEIEDAQRIKREAEARATVYQAKLDHLAQDTENAREALVRSGEAERDRIVAEAEAKAERMRKDALFMVEQEMKQIRQDLMRDAVEAAVGAAEALLKSTITHADQERLAEDYLLGLLPPKVPPSGPARVTEPPTRSPS